MRLIACASFALLVACSSPSPNPDAGGDDSGTEADDGGPDAIVSGSRLRARWEIAGTSRRFIGWHDNQLNLDCDFTQYASGRKHLCLPPMAQGTTGGPYADPACTQPLALPNGFVLDCMNVAYGMQQPLNACTTEPTFFAVSVFDGGTAYGLGLDGGCIAEPGFGQLYQVGSSVASTTFVSATEMPGSDGQFWLVGSDGSKSPWGGWDGTRAVEPLAVADAGVEWTPWMIAFDSNIFADSACTVPAASKGGGNARCPLDAVQAYAPFDACAGTTVTYRAIGPALSSVYDSTCASEPATSSVLYFSIGAPLTDFKPVHYRDVGAGPTKVRYATLGDKAIRQTGLHYDVASSPPVDAFIDVSSGITCNPAMASDGKLRCMPAFEQDFFFLDDQCTIPVAQFGQPCNGPPIAVVTHAISSGTACGAPTVHAYALLAPIDAGTVYTQLDGCRAGAAPSPLMIYPFGAELDPTTFGEVTYDTE